MQNAGSHSFRARGRIRTVVDVPSCLDRSADKSTVAISAGTLSAFAAADPSPRRAGIVAREKSTVPMLAKPEFTARQSGTTKNAPDVTNASLPTQKRSSVAGNAGTRSGQNERHTRLLDGRCACGAADFSTYMTKAKPGGMIRCCFATENVTKYLPISAADPGRLRSGCQLRESEGRHLSRAS